MLVTINTDASFNIDHKIGAYALWIVSNDFSFKMGGAFKDSCLNPSDAEIKAIMNAIYLVSTQEVPVTRIIINTDCQPAIDFFNRGLRGKGHERKSYWKKLKKRMHKMIRQIPGDQIKVEFRHVKAHNGITDKRSYVNDWCDKTAKKFMREAVKEYLDEVE